MRRLQALHAVVQHGSVRAAAQALGYTPSTISQHVSALERQTSTVLLEPSGRGVRPTAAGLLLAERAADLLARMAETEAALAALTAGEMGVLRLASFATAGSELIPPALATTRARLPGLDVTLRIAEHDDALDLLRAGMLDLVVIETHDHPENTSALSYLPLLTDPFRIVLPKGHRLARRRVVSLADAADEPWIDIRSEIGCCHAATNAAFHAAGFTPRREVEADEYWPAQGFVAAGLGLALIPVLALGVQHTGVVVRRLSPRDQPVRHVLAVTRPAVERTAPVRTMIAALRREISR
ncbi:LysR family transcriptional regulator [Lentzea sp. CA-135723]|uniref:LysR family transcriptional regulator n=1 Tax=Lentzea sp. CA-135723 TaxID=3239950 RepID=UPI003D8F751C